jgi:hypothetical protein
MTTQDYIATELKISMSAQEPSLTIYLKTETPIGITPLGVF